MSEEVKVTKRRGRPAKDSTRDESIEARTESRERTESRRERRVPLGAPRLKLAVPDRNGYKRRWVNDDGGRLQEAQDGGYQFVTDSTLHVGHDVENGNSDMGSRVSRIVGKTDGGEPLRAFLMEIKQEWYDEDQAEKQKKVDEIDEAIKHGDAGSSGLSADERYEANGGIRISGRAGR